MSIVYCYLMTDKSRQKWSYTVTTLLEMPVQYVRSLRFTDCDIVIIILLQ
jgi:hypothetical protein